MKDKKNADQALAINDDALDEVSGGGFAIVQTGYERQKDDPVVWKYLCRYCGAWRKETELDACQWNCPTCGQHIDRETAERSL